MSASLRPPFIYLASQSPRRRQLLEQMGVAHELLLPDAHEDVESMEAPLTGEAPAHYVKRVTLLKLDAAMKRLKRRGMEHAPVLCSDTTVALGPTLFGKPLDAQHACKMLALLAGRTHRVLTAVALQIPQEAAASAEIYTCLSVSHVTFEALTPQQIRNYVASGEPLGKAGAYAIQGRAAMHVRSMRGSYSGIMGLPIHETSQLLRQAGLSV
jgi:septum formation protein